MEAFVDESRDIHHFGRGVNDRGNVGAKKGDVSGRKMPAKGKGKKDLGYWGLGVDEAPVGGGGATAAAAAAAAPTVGGGVGGRRRRGTKEGSKGDEKWRIDDPFKGF